MKPPFCKFQTVAFGAFLAILMVSPAARASYLTNYGNFSATTVNFNQVTESSISESNPLYRDPIVSGNSLVFNPHLFGAFAAGGTSDLTDGQLSLTISANAGSAIPTIKFWERGDFTLVGAGTSLTYVDVTANFYVTVLKIDGVTPAGGPVVLPAGSMSFAPVANGTFDLPTYPGVGSLWLGVYNLDVNAALAAEGISGYIFGATELRFTLDNELYAQSEAGTQARILKKEIAGSVGIEVLVPEPSTFALTLCAAGLLFARRRSVR